MVALWHGGMTARHAGMHGIHIVCDRLHSCPLPQEGIATHGALVQPRLGHEGPDALLVGPLEFPDAIACLATKEAEMAQSGMGLRPDRV